MGGAYTLYTFLASYMATLGVTGAAFAGVLALFGAGAFLGNLMGGWASDRLGPPRVLAVGIGGLGLATLGGITMAQGGPSELGYAGAVVELVALLFLAAERRATLNRRRAVAPAAAE